MPQDYMTDPLQTPESAPAFFSMLEHAKSVLAGVPPAQIARAAGVTFNEDASAFSFASLGRKIAVSYPGYDVTFADTGQMPLNYWVLSILHYLYAADGTPLSGELATFRTLRDGAVRGGNFDRECSRTLAAAFADKPLDNIRRACEALGAELTKSSADLTAVFSFLPRYPLTVKIWLADDEISGSGQILPDKSADHYLSLEHSVVVGGLLLELLQRQYGQMFPETA